MAATTPIKMPGTPRPWMNAFVRLMLRTPGVRRVLGKTFAVITVTGSVTGNRYSTPVQYFPHDGGHVVLSQRTRRWWRNIARQPAVQLLVRGEPVDGKAVLADEDKARTILRGVLAANPRVAKFYGLGLDDDGAIDAGAVDRLLEHVVVIVISPEG